MFMVMFAYKTVHHGWILGVYTICFIFQVVIDFEAKHRLKEVGSYEKKQSASYYKSPKATSSKKNVFHFGGHGHGHGHGGHGGGHGHKGHQGSYYRRKHGKNGYHKASSNADMMENEESRTIREMSHTQLSFIGMF